MQTVGCFSVNPGGTVWVAMIHITVPRMHANNTTSTRRPTFATHIHRCFNHIANPDFVIHLNLCHLTTGSRATTFTRSQCLFHGSFGNFVMFVSSCTICPWLRGRGNYDASWAHRKPRSWLPSVGYQLNRFVVPSQYALSPHDPPRITLLLLS